MSTSAFILTQQATYSPEKLLSDTIVAVFHADLLAYFHNFKTYSSTGEFSYTTMNIIENTPGEDQPQFEAQPVLA